MESTGIPEKIQISQQFKEDLNKFYPEFLTTLRGEIEVKVSVKIAIKITSFLFREKALSQRISSKANAARSKRPIHKRKMP